MNTLKNKNMNNVKQIIDRPFFYCENFYEDFDTFVDSLWNNGGYPPDNENFFFETIEVYVAEEEPILNYNLDSLLEVLINVNEDRFSEDCDEIPRIKKILKENINFDNIREQMPTMFYETYEKIKITQQDIKQYIEKL